MKKFALLLSLVFAAGVAAADQAQKAEAAKPAAKTPASEKAEKAAPAKTHVVTAEVVSVDIEKNTVTIKGEKENQTAPVEGKAIATLKTVKAGAKYAFTCRDNEKGEHQAITAISPAKEAKPAAAKAPAKN
jgi:Zn/Cd-binding protein ZinT